VPAKFACLFLKGLSLIEGFVLGCELLHLTLDRFAEEKELWAGFLWSAVTKRAAGDATSALDTVWMWKDPYANGALTNWYFSLIAQAPAYAALAYAANTNAAPAHAAPAPLAPAYAANALDVHAATAAATNLPNTVQAADASLTMLLWGEGDEGVPLFYGVDQRADLTTTTIDLLQAMTDRLANGLSSSWSIAKHYDWVELEYLFQRVGTHR
jgi:hypothetical protein